MNWQQVLPLLGVAVTNSLLPQRFQCPLCHKDRLRVYPDTILGGEWFHCLACKSSGNMIDLLCKAWNLPAEAAIRKAQVSGGILPVSASSDTVIADYLGTTHRRNTIINDFWERAKKYFIKSESQQLRFLQQHIGVAGQLGQDWSNKGGMFVGAATHHEFNDCVTSKGPSTAPRIRGTMFRAGNEGKWGDVLVLPFYDLPGRICAFMCVGRQGREIDKLIRPVFGTSSQGETGVSMLSSLFSKHTPRLGNDIFVMDDPIMALRLQLRHLKENSLPLPMVGAYTSDNGRMGSKAVWNWLPTSKTICWSASPGVPLLRLAKLAKSQVSAVAAADWNIEGSLRYNRDPVAWLQAAAVKANNWRDVLREKLRPLSLHAVQEILLDIDLCGPELRCFIDDSDAELQTKLQDVVANNSIVTRVRFEQHNVYEHDDSWYIRKSGTSDLLISNAIVRVTQVLTATNEKTYYRGIVRHKGVEYPFTEQSKTLERGFFPWLKDFLLVNNAGVLRHTASWSNKALQLSFSFHEPTIIRGLDSAGWDATQKQFNFPTFAITSTGDVLADPTQLLPGHNVAGQTLSPPARLHYESARILSKSDEETSVFWATLACVVNNIVAPAMFSHPTGILLDGDGAQRIGASAATYLGCPEVDVNVTSSTSVRTRYYSTRTPKFNWPSLNTTPGSTGSHAVTMWLQSPAAQQTILCVNAPAAKILGMRGQWHTICCNRKLGSMQLPLQRAATQALPAYLHDLCKRQMWITQHDNESELFNLLSDMADWFDKCGGDRNTVLNAMKMIETPSNTDVCTHFVGLLLYLRNNGKLAFVNQDFEDVVPLRKRLHIKYLSNPSRLWIPQDTVCDALHTAADIPPDLLLITESLAERGVLLGEEVFDSQKGWVVDEAWYSSSEKKLEKIYAESIS